VSFLPLENNVERKDDILERLNADVSCRQENVQCHFSLNNSIPAVFVVLQMSYPDGLTPGLWFY